ncbi:unnamed protein product [Adineta ricciae]|uniref:Uncharacterized protein n=1 Tax=Adineta ricciae TaxID=249248 RepID=A0A816DH13_ADIRI|nr:unnamed protein product [Adineta ricciae]
MNGTRSNTGNSGNVRSYQNVHMFRMVIVQISLTSILQIPFAVLFIYTYLKPVITDPLIQQVYFTSAFIARWLYVANYCKTFYVNTLTSKLFRSSLRQQCLDLFSRRRTF